MIPDSLDDITPEWLTTALRSGGALGVDQHPTGVAIEPVEGLELALLGHPVQLVAFRVARGPPESLLL